MIQCDECQGSGVCTWCGEGRCGKCEGTGEVEVPEDNQLQLIEGYK